MQLYSRRYLYMTGLILLIGTLVSCIGTDPFSDLKAQMEEIKQRPAGQIEPLPAYTPYKSFMYSAALFRSPFQPPVEIKQIQTVLKGKKVTPDFDRPKEILEEFGLDSLSVVGTIQREPGTLFALVQDSKGGIHRVTIGNYMGRNHGRIVGLTKTQIDLIELVSDGSSGWIERPRTLALRE